MTTERNQERVDRRLARLREGWGQFPVEDVGEIELTGDVFEGMLDRTREGYTGSGYAWVVRRAGEAAPLSESMPEDAADDRDRVLLILSRGGSTWGLPGGGLEAGETYEEATRREVTEETGIECSLTAVAHAWRGAYVSGAHPDRIHALYVAFRASYEGGHVAIQPGELNGAAWFADLPNDVGWVAEPLAEAWGP